MHQVLFYIGEIPVRAFGFMLALGILCGVLVSYLLAKRQGSYYEEVVDVASLAVIGGIVGARLWEVIFTWQYYSQHLLEIPALWRGGLSIQGAVLGGLVAVIWYCRSKVPFWNMADLLAPGLLVGQAIGRLGCFLNGCCFGIPHPLGIVYPPGTDAYYTYGTLPLFPAVLLESFWDLVVLSFLLIVFKRKPFEGFIALSYFILYSVGRFFFEFWRGDSLITFMNLKVAQVTSVVTIIVALSLMIYLANRNKINYIKKFNDKRI